MQPAASYRAAGSASEAEAWDSVRQRDFVERGLRDPATQEFRPVTAIGGVGKHTEARLAELGFPYAYQLIGQYMVNSLDDEATAHWLETEVRVLRKDLRRTIVRSLAMWCDRHL